MKLKERKLNIFVSFVKFKLILAIIVVQIASSNIGAALNASIYQGMEALGNVYFSIYLLDVSLGVAVTIVLSIVISSIIIVFI